MGLIDFIKSLFASNTTSENAVQTSVENEEPEEIESKTIPSETVMPSEDSTNLKTTKTMKTSELLLEFLREQGFCPKQKDDTIAFKCQMRNFVYFINDEDPSYFRICMPAIFDVTEDNRDAVLAAANDVNQEYKIAKIIVANESVWVIAESILDTTPQLEDIVPRFLQILMDAQQGFYEKIN